MELQPTSPELGINLATLRRGFDEDQVAVIEPLFRLLFANLSSFQKTAAQVINWNSLHTVDTADIPAASVTMDNTMIIEYTGSLYNLIYYAGGLRYRITSGVTF